ncbi:hypothetical protein [Roseomonas populi]|uniref:Uncharacterized protein n=1 Tax=Roseomonas populi TaxID=3121582 RepID=A0ABT1X6D0_9PROT|nr:hypothetical protein [Roseomonas pecuniae]MCR0983662.1 hypothetical protein [Roseomonas pecuniae]
MSPPMPLDAPLVAVFADDESALAAVSETRADLLRMPAPGVVLLRPAQGLRERLYAAGAAVVVP